MEIVIEKNIPMPISHLPSTRLSMSSMEVGDSFLFSKEKRNRVCVGAHLLKPKKFTTRTVDVKNCRAWRIE